MVAVDECQVCGHQGPDVRQGLVHWRATEHQPPTWEAVPRCPDRTACAQRIADAGKPWPLWETDRRVLAIITTPAPPPEPAPAVEDPSSWW
jgi:hypothetical protein